MTTGAFTAADAAIITREVRVLKHSRRLSWRARWRQWRRGRLMVRVERDGPTLVDTYLKAARRAARDGRSHCLVSLPDSNFYCPEGAYRTELARYAMAGLRQVGFSIWLTAEDPLIHARLESPIRLYLGIGWSSP